MMVVRLPPAHPPGGMPSAPSPKTHPPSRHLHVKRAWWWWWEGGGGSVQRRHVVAGATVALVLALQLVFMYQEWVAENLGPAGMWPPWGAPVARSAWACADCGCPGLGSPEQAAAAGCLPSDRLLALAEGDNWPALAHGGLWPAAHEEHLDAPRCWELARATGAVANASSPEAAAVRAAGHLLPPRPANPPLGREAASSRRQPKQQLPQPTIMFHLYVRLDLAPFGRWPAATVASVLATQPPGAVVVIWSPQAAVGAHPVVRALTASFPGRVFFRVFDAAREAVGTPLEGAPAATSVDGRGWMDSDLFRLVALYHYGGVYLDTDVLLARDMGPLLGHDWSTEFGCDHPTRFNNAVMRFRRRSAGIAVLASRAAVLPLRPGTWDYGPHLLERVDGKWLWWRRGGLFRQVPWCFFHGRWCPSGGVTIRQQTEGGVPPAPGAEGGAFGLHYHGVTRHVDPHPASLLGRWEAEHARVLSRMMAAKDGGSSSGSWPRTLEAALAAAAAMPPVPPPASPLGGGGDGAPEDDAGD
jgi:hypothetical protein